MNRNALIEQIRRKKSFLCIGLDTDPDKIPSHLGNGAEGILKFNKAIIQATKDYAVSYKINTAFYEALGAEGWFLMEETINMLPEDVLIIADAKRGDIGNTSTRYAKAFFETLNCDALTLSPYMGSDSIQPFLEFEGKWSILLALTSNKGGGDFQLLQTGDKELYKKVLEVSSKWGSPENMMYVVGATKAEYLSEIRQIVPDHFLLVPGVGAQGGSLEEVVKHGANKDIGLLINSSRGILYASSGEDFDLRAKEEAAKLQQQMANFIG